MAPGRTKRERDKQPHAKPTTRVGHVDADELDNVRLISARETRRLLGDISDMQLWRMVHSPALEFPRPIKLSDMVAPGKKPRIISTRNFFRFRDIKAWIAKREALGIERAA
jgi:predicted DNA-binding transcriptional regulator AlpA